MRATTSAENGGDKPWQYTGYSDPKPSHLHDHGGVFSGNSSVLLCVAVVTKDMLALCACRVDGAACEVRSSFVKLGSDQV